MCFFIFSVEDFSSFFMFNLGPLPVESDGHDHPGTLPRGSREKSLGVALGGSFEPRLRHRIPNIKQLQEQRVYVFKYMCEYTKNIYVCVNIYIYVQKFQYISIYIYILHMGFLCTLVPAGSHHPPYCTTNHPHSRTGRVYSSHETLSLSSTKCITSGEELGVAKTGLEADLDTSRSKAEPSSVFRNFKNWKGRGTRNMTWLLLLCCCCCCCCCCRGSCYCCCCCCCCLWCIATPVCNKEIYTVHTNEINKQFMQIH